MTIWSAWSGEIFEIEADALICSANPRLELSGGVGGELRRRFGEAMQAWDESFRNGVQD